MGLLGAAVEPGEDFDEWFLSLLPRVLRLAHRLTGSHTLAEDVGRIAKAAAVKTLVLSHLVPGDDPSVTRELWERAARTSFDGKIIVGADLMEIPL